MVNESGAHVMVRTCAPQSPAQHPRFSELVAEDCFCMLCIVVGVVLRLAVQRPGLGLETIAYADHAAFLERYEPVPSQLPVILNRNSLGNVVVRRIYVLCTDIKGETGNRNVVMHGPPAAKTQIR